MTAQAKKHRTYSLWAILLLAVLVCSVTIGGVIGGYVKRYEISFLKERLHEQNKYALQLMAAGSIDAVIAQDRPVLRTLIEKIGTQSTIESIVIYDDGGHELVARKASRELPIHERMSVMVPVYHESEYFGAISVTWNLKSQLALIDSHADSVQYIVTFSLSIFTVILIYLGRVLVVRPIQEVNHRLMELASSSKDRSRYRTQFRTEEFQRLSDTVDFLENELADKEQRTIQLHQAERKADVALAASEAKTEFLSIMSHEIRTPMNSVLGFAQILQKTDLSSSQRKHVELLEQSGRLLLHIINEILDFSKLEAGKIDLENVPIELPKIVENIVTVQWQRVADTSSVDLGYWIDPDVPLWVLGDKPRCQQILMNLVGNALKFTEKGHVFVALEIFKGQRADVEIPPGALGIHVSVEDTGIGINEKAIAGIFDPFEQADLSTTREFGGTGLGLSICSKIVEASGGAIWVESEVGRGSTFHVVLPMHKAPGSDDSDDLIQDIESFSGKKILLVHSSDRLREATEKHFESLGLEVFQQADVLSNRPLVPDFGVLYGHPLDQKFKKDVTALRRRFDKLPILLVLKEEVGDLEGVIPEAESCEVIFQPCTYREVDRRLRRVGGGEGGDSCADDELDADADSEDTAALFAKLHPQKILVAEDVKVNQILIKAFLRQLGYDVAFASDGVECLEKLQVDDYSIVLMDMRMPRMDGHTAAIAIRAGEAGESNRDIPIAALTANVLPHDRERCNQVGMTDFLSKPLVEDELKRVLSSSHK